MFQCTIMAQPASLSGGRSGDPCSSPCDHCDGLTCAAQDLPREQEESLLRLFTSDVVASIKARKLEQAQVGPAQAGRRGLGLMSVHDCAACRPPTSHVCSSETAHPMHPRTCSCKLADQACCSA